MESRQFNCSSFGAPRNNLGMYSGQIGFRELLQSFRYVSHNLVDRKAYPSLVQQEEFLKSFVIDTLGGRAGKEVIMTSGSSEAILLAMSAHLASFRSTHRVCAVKQANFVISELAHNVFFKFARLFDVELRTVEVNDNGQIVVESVKKLVDENTFCLVGIAGTTETGSIDDLLSLSVLAKSKGIPFHIDAASGGNIVPYLCKRNSLKDSLNPYSSINLSLAKYGGTAPGVGALMIEKECLERLDMPSLLPYISGGPTSEKGLLCSRNSLPMASCFSHLHRKSPKIIKRRVALQMIRARKIKRCLRENGFQVLPNRLPVVVFRHDVRAATELFMLGMQASGCIVPEICIQPLREKYLRIVVRKDLSKKIFNRLLREIRRSVSDEACSGIKKNSLRDFVFGRRRAICRNVR